MNSVKHFGKGYDWYMDRNDAIPGRVKIQFVQSLSEQDWVNLQDLVADFDRKRRTLEQA